MPLLAVQNVSVSLRDTHPSCIFWLTWTSPLKKETLLVFRKMQSFLMCAVSPVSVVLPRTGRREHCEPIEVCSPGTGRPVSHRASQLCLTGALEHRFDGGSGCPVPTVAAAPGQSVLRRLPTGAAACGATGEVTCSVRPEGHMLTPAG